MRTLIKNIKELVGVESTPQLKKQGKEMGMLETVGYIGVLLISIFVLKERPTKRGLIGGAVCIAGVIFFYL